MYIVKKGDSVYDESEDRTITIISDHFGSDFYVEIEEDITDEDCSVIGTRKSNAIFTQSEIKRLFGTSQHVAFLSDSHEFLDRCLDWEYDHVDDHEDILLGNSPYQDDDGNWTLDCEDDSSFYHLTEIDGELQLVYVSDK